MAESVNFDSAGVSITAELYQPIQTSNLGAIIIAHGTDGVTDHLNGPWATMMRGYAEALSSKGFVALIPHYFSRTGTVPGPAVLEQMLIHRGHWQDTIADAATYARSLPGVDASRIGLLGFSLGGHVCLRLRATSKVLVEFFAPQLDLARSPATLALHAQIHHGEEDSLVSFIPNARNIKSILQAEGANCEMFSYPGAGHGFAGDDSDNKSARDRSMERTISFFESHL
jgi:dienelactone hydrolase